MTAPVVSVILIVRNGAAYVRDALESVRAQTRLPDEVLVIDGGSTDGTAAIVAEFPGVRLIAQEGAGIPGAWNQGIREARGDLLAFLSHDDRWAPHKLAVQLAAMEARPELWFTVAHFRYELVAPQPPPGFNPQLLGRDLPGRIMETLVARRGAFEKVGLFDPAYRTAEDVDWFARAGELGAPILLVPEVLLTKRVHGGNTSGDAAQNTPALMRALRASLARRARVTVSAILAVYNGEAYVAQALESIFAQVEPPDEVILVDDGSTDRTATIARSFEKVKIIEQANAGQATALNRGVEASTGALLAFLDADDLWTPDKLELQKAVLAARPELDAAFGHAEQFLDGAAAAGQTSARPGPLMPAHLPGAMLVRRAAFQRIGPFDTTIKLVAVFEWYVRAKNAGLASEMLPAMVLRRRIHGQNQGFTKRDLRSEYLSVIKAALDRKAGR